MNESTIASETEAATNVASARKSKTQTGDWTVKKNSSGGKNAANRQLVSREFLAQAAEMLSFDDCPELCRAVPLAEVTKNCASIWSGSAGSESTYAKSKFVTVIDAFLSHNWAVGRFRKWAALSFHFNFRQAALGTILIHVPVSILCCLEILPASPSVDDGDDMFLWNRLVSGPTYFFLLFFGRNILARFGARQPDVFLDKVCIHQVNHSIRSRGIMKLGAFLARSEEMVILYTNIYLKKLWTIYEVAAFLVLRENAADCMKVVPVPMVAVFLGAFTVGYVDSAGGALLNVFGISFTFVIAIGVVCSLLYMTGLRAWQREKVLTQARIKEFEVRDCICAVESDRHVVYANIAALIRAFGFAHPTASLDTALDAFNELVRSETPAAFKSAFGLCAFNYYHYAWVGFMICGALVFDHLCSLVCSPRHGLHAAGAAVSLIWLFVVWPLYFAFHEILMSWRLDWTGCKEAVWIVVAMLMIGIPTASWLQFVRWLMDRSDEANFALALTLSLGIVSTIGGLFGVYASGGCSRRKTTKTDAQMLPTSFASIVPPPMANSSEPVALDSTLDSNPEEPVALESTPEEPMAFESTPEGVSLDEIELNSDEGYVDFFV